MSKRPKKFSMTCRNAETLVRVHDCKHREPSQMWRSAAWKIAQVNAGKCETYGTLAEESLESLECDIVAIERSEGADRAMP